MVAEGTCLLLHFAETGLDAEPFGIQFYDLYCCQRKIGTDQNAFLVIVFHEYKTKFRIEFLSPEQIHAFISDRLVSSIYRNKGFRKGIRIFCKLFPEIDRIAFLFRTATFLYWFSNRFLICDTVAFRFGNKFKPFPFCTCIELVQFT